MSAAVVDGLEMRAVLLDRPHHRVVAIWRRPDVESTAWSPVCFALERHEPDAMGNPTWRTAQLISCDMPARIPAEVWLRQWFHAVAEELLAKTGGKP